MNLPMVLVNALPGQEQANAAHLQEKGCAAWVRRGQLAETVRDILIHPEKRAEMAEKCGPVTEDSSEKIVKILYGMLGNGK